MIDRVICIVCGLMFFGCAVNKCNTEIPTDCAMINVRIFSNMMNVRIFSNSERANAIVDADMPVEGLLQMLRDVEERYEINHVEISARHMNEILDLKCLSDCTKLTYLAIRGSPEQRVRVASIDVLAKTKIKNLVLRDVEIEDISYLARLHELSSFETNQQILLRNVPCEIEELSIRDSFFDAVCDLTRFSHLKKLMMFNVGCSTILGISEMRDLEQLSIICPLDEVFPIETCELLGCSKLKTLELESGAGKAWLFDFEQLAKLPLQKLSLVGFPIRRVSGLENSTIENLELMHCPISGLHAISFLPNLIELDVAYTGVDCVDRNLARKLFPRIKHIEFCDSTGGSDCEEWDDDL